MTEKKTETTDSKAEPQRKTRGPNKTPAQKIQEIVQSLNAEQYMELIGQGYVIPRMTGEEPNKWAARCPRCNDIAFEFVGTSFRNAQGEIVESPQEVPVYLLPVSWNRKEAFNPAAPRCQDCNLQIPVDHNGAVRRKFVVDQDLWKQSRDDGLRELERNRRGGTGNQPREGTVITDAGVSLRDAGNEVWVDPEAKQAVSDAADRLNLMGQLKSRLGAS